jgi:hypothetical protein
MRRTLFCSLSVAVILVAASRCIPAENDPVQVDPKDWRGPARNGIAADQRVPAEWSETKNVVWFGTMRIPENIAV